MDNIIGIVTICALVFFGVWLGHNKSAAAIERIANEAVDQCEETLPRHKHCEFVITAKELPND